MRTRLLLLSGLAVAVAVTAVALLLTGGADVALSDRGGANSAGASVSGDQANEAAVDEEGSPSQPGGSASKSAGSEADEEGSVVLSADDPLVAATEEACAQFRAGVTVDDFADWFAGEMGTVTDEVEALFRAAVERALTEECPEVLPNT